MVINWNLNTISYLCRHCSAFSNVDKLLSDIRESKTVNFFVCHETKTSLNVEISNDIHPENTFSVGYIPPGAEKYSFHKRNLYQIFEDKSSSRYFFKISNKQGLDEFKDYLALILSHVVPSLESITVNVIFYKVPEFHVQRTI